MLGVPELMDPGVPDVVATGEVAEEFELDL